MFGRHPVEADARIFVRTKFMLQRSQNSTVRNHLWVYTVAYYHVYEMLLVNKGR